jgi:DNA-binding transcriptional LysR family regulator
MDRLTSMAVFARAVELGSFSAAAEALEMSSQLVGKHVRLLEQHLGVQLLNRTTRRQSLTSVGQSFYERAKNILAEVEAAESVAAETRAMPRGRLRINAPVSFGVHALAPKLPDYLKQFPEVSVELNLSNRFVDLIDEGYDAVFRVGDLADSVLMARKLAPYQLVLCASPVYLGNAPPLDRPQDLENHECITFAVSSTRYEWVFEGPEGCITVPIKSRLIIDNGEALRTAARAGMGLIFQPQELVKEDLRAGLLVELLPSFKAEAKPFHVLYAPDRRMTPKLRSFLDFAVSSFG